MDRNVLTKWLHEEDYKHSSSGFMGKSWDSFVPGPSIWRECYRVLKPGGFIIVFTSTRTYDFTSIALRIAGFILHPCIVWLNSQGFPKGTDLSSIIDKRPKAMLSKFASELKNCRKKLKLSITEADKLITGGTTMYSFLEGRKVNNELITYPPNGKYYRKIVEHFGLDGWDDIIENNLDVVGDE